ncbi:MAG: CPBP family intramembrane glutamic endopeptidase [Bryobacteraceae bacterium]
MLGPAFLVCVLLLLLSRSLQKKLRLLISETPALIFIVPALLDSVFCVTASYYDSLTWRLTFLVLLYTCVPTLCIHSQMTRFERRTASWLDLGVILLLWLPLEFSAGASLVPRSMHGVLHASAYGVAVTLGVALFVLARQWKGMRYALPRSFSDVGNFALGYLISVLLLIPLGLWVGFLAHPHWPRMSLGSAAFRILLIFLGTAFPEEILFRALIQNWLTQRMQQKWKAVVVSGVVFGAAHLNNAPGPLPNWRYMAVATIAGLIFGTVFLRSTSVLASTSVHAAVNATKYLFF